MTQCSPQDQAHVLCWQPDFFKNGLRKILSGWTGTGPHPAVRSVATKMVFLFCPWSTATATKKQPMRRPKARQTGTLAVAESIPRQRQAGLDTEPDHNAAKRTKASTSPDRYDGGAVFTRTSGLGNTRNNHNTSKHTHKTSNERNIALLASARGRGRSSHPNARSAGRAGTPGQCKRTGSVEPSERPVGRKRGLPGTA